MNKKQFMGLVTFSLIIGGTIYCIKKYKESQESQDLDGNVISLDEAREMVKQSKNGIGDDLESRVKESTIEVGESFGMSREEIEELVDEARDEASFNNSFTQPSEYDFYDGLDYTRPLSQYIKEEDKVLRFEPNSIQARDHFIKMELAELLPANKEYQIMKRLFDFHFEPLNDGDDILYSQLADHRQEFFGPDSRWNNNVSMADIITHYARLTDFNIGGGVDSWIIHFVQHTDFNELSAASKFEEIIIKLNQHKFNNPRTNTYSIFGLSYDDLFDAQLMADDTIDREITYEIEFNTFLKNESYNY